MLFSAKHLITPLLFRVPVKSAVPQSLAKTFGSLHERQAFFHYETWKRLKSRQSATLKCHVTQQEETPPLEFSYLF